MARAGTINLVDGYAEAAEAKGFVFMDTPGHDCIAATGYVAGGANLFRDRAGQCVRLQAGAKHQACDQYINV